MKSAGKFTAARKKNPTRTLMPMRMRNRKRITRMHMGIDEEASKRNKWKNKEGKKIKQSHSRTESSKVSSDST